MKKKLLKGKIHRGIGDEWALIKYFETTAFEQGWTNDEIYDVTKSLWMGNYENCISALARHFEDPNYENFK